MSYLPFGHGIVISNLVLALYCYEGIYQGVSILLLPILLAKKYMYQANIMKLNNERGHRCSQLRLWNGIGWVETSRVQSRPYRIYVILAPSILIWISAQRKVLRGKFSLPSILLREPSSFRQCPNLYDELWLDTLYFRFIASDILLSWCNSIRRWPALSDWCYYCAD